jgi:hypothetical protein
MARQIRDCGYQVNALQSTQGAFAGKFEIVEDGSNVLLAIQANVGIRFIGKRNMNFTAITTMLAGTGGWRNCPLPHPWIAGFNTAETNCCFWTNPDSTFVACLMQRDELLQGANEFSRKVLNHCNVAHPDLFRHQPWETEFMHRFKGGKPKECFVKLTNHMLETAEPITLPLTTNAQVQVLDGIPALLERLRTGEDITVKQAAQESYLSLSGYKNIVTEFTGMTPKQLISLTKTEGVMEMLRDPLRRRSCGVQDTLISISDFYNWSEASARKNLKDLTGQMPAELLVRHR